MQYTYCVVHQSWHGYSRPKPFCTYWRWRQFSNRLFFFFYLLNSRLQTNSQNNNLSHIKQTHHNIYVWLKCAAVTWRALASYRTLTLATVLMSLRYYCYVTNMASVEGVRCPSFRTQLSGLFWVHCIFKYRSAWVHLCNKILSIQYRRMWIGTHIQLALIKKSEKNDTQVPQHTRIMLFWGQMIKS